MAKKQRGVGGKSPGGGSAGASKPKHSLSVVGRTNGSTNTHERSAATVRRLQMYKQRPVRDAKGKILKQDLQSKELPSTRIVPDRRWFGNTRVIGQKQLEEFREEMATKSKDGYTVLIKQKKLPLSLLKDPERGRARRVNLLGQTSFADTFGSNKRRKKPKLASDDLQALASNAEKMGDVYTEGVQTGVITDRDLVVEDDGVRREAKAGMFEKGQSKRIWGELYKVVDSSDVIIQVIDVRDPMGTRCYHLEQHLKKDAMKRHKHMILLLNKVDLVPAWVTKRWLHTLSREFPTIAFHASVSNPFGKGAVLSLLRQFSRLRMDKQNISVGFVGYPNVGKSSVINALRAKRVCITAPIPGETKVWQYVNLTKRIFLIDCPGVVYHDTEDTDTDSVLKGVTRISNLDDAQEHIADVVARVKAEYLRRAYKIPSWTDPDDFLRQVARMNGKLLKGGEEDVNAVAKVILQDWQRGRIPWFAPPPSLPDGPSQTTVNVLESASAVEKEAAQGFAAVAAEVTMRQVHRRMPQAHGLFDEEDAHDQEYATEDEDEPASEAEDDDDDDDNEDDGEGGKASKRKRDALSDDEVDEERDEDEEEDEKQAPPVHGELSESEDVDINDETGGGIDEETLKKFASDDDEDDNDDSDSDSDGYGPGGLSFDQVLAEIKGEVKEKPSGVSGSNKSHNKKPRGETYGAAKPKGKTHKGTVSFVSKAKADDGKRDRSKGARRPTREKRSKMLDI